MRAPSRETITATALGLAALGLYLATLSRWYSAVNGASVWQIAGR